MPDEEMRGVSDPIDVQAPVQSTRSTSGERRPSMARYRLLGWAQQNGMFFALLLLCVFFALRSDNFLTITNLSVIAGQAATVGIIAVPGAMLVLSGYVDLSVGSLMVLAAAVFGQVFEAGTGTPGAVLAALAAGAAWGAVNAAFISGLNFSPIVVTLAGLAGARGLAEVLTQGRTVSQFGEGFSRLARSQLLGQRAPVWIAVAVFAVGFYVWTVGPWGRHMTAIGADEVAARSVGIRTRRIPAVLYIGSGLSAALAGLIFTSRLDGASLSIGVGQELVVLSAILLGGISFTGGRGSLLGVLSGVLFLGVLQNGLILIGVGVFFQNVALGAALFFAAALDAAYRRLERLPVGVDERQGILADPEVGGRA
jgi:ribose transport system permease protein